MESQSKSSAFIDSITNLKLVLYTVLEYLAPQDLTNLYMSLKTTANSNQQILESILQAYLYIRLHMNNTDRSFYYTVYSNHRMLEIEKLNIAYVVQSNNKFKQLFKQRQENVKLLRSILTESGCQQITNQIVRFSDDPEIPMLKLLRETVGVGCNSTFSNFLLSLRDDAFAMDIEEYPNLSEFYQKRTNETYINQFFQIGNLRAKHNHFFKVQRLRLAPHLIKLENKKEYFMQNNEMHNLIVVLFCFAEQMVQATAEYLQGIEDPFYRLLQFCLRYSIYRNFILCIQEKLGFIFQNYSNLYQDYIDRSNLTMPQFSFWRPAMSKWYQTLHPFHKSLTQTHQIFILTNRYKNIQHTIQNLQQKDRSQQYTVVRNNIKSNNVDIYEKIGIKGEGQEMGEDIQMGMGEMVDVMGEDLVYCVGEFCDYVMDVSVDEVSVHWCGYTKQKLGVPYTNFQEQILKLNQKFLQQITNKIQNPILLQTLLNSDLSFITANNYYKPKTLSQIESHSTALLTKLTQNPKICLTQYRICMDQKICIYNQHQGIPQQVSASQLPYYQIVPMPEEQITRYIEKHSISTLECTEGSFDEGVAVYVSDDEGEEGGGGGERQGDMGGDGSMDHEIEFSNSIHKDNMQEFMQDQSQQSHPQDKQSGNNTFIK